MTRGLTVMLDDEGYNDVLAEEGCVLGSSYWENMVVCTEVRG